MRNAQTTKTNHYFRILVALAVMATVASLLVGPATRTAYAAGTTFTITNTNDSGAGSLRQAILDANATTDADVIEFDIAGTGVQTIKPSTPLPPITRQVTIDGYTQQGSAVNTKTVGDDAVLKIELDGSNLPNDNGLEIDTSDGSVIRGLVINRFASGITIHGDSVGNCIEGNFIGTDPTGTLDRGNINDGVTISDGPSETVVGGTTAAARNVISGNSDTGILVANGNGNRIQGNYIGTDKSGTKDLGNTDGGVSMFDTTGNTVGGTTTTSRNVISGNDVGGLLISESQQTKVLGNRIGTTANRTGALGNSSYGVRILASSDNLIGDGTAGGSNTIAFNGQDGVEVFNFFGISATGNEVSRNSIYSNAGLGIDLIGSGENFDTNVSTPNDPGDADAFANNLQNKPVLSSAKTSSTRTTVAGTLNSTQGRTFTLRFYSNPSGTDEGKKFIGQKSVSTDASGNASFTFQPASKVATGQAITATATSSGGDTSEFSAPRKVVAS